MREGTLLSRSPDVLSRSFAGETLVAAPTGGDVDRLTASAGVIWDLLAEPRSFDEITSDLATTYGAPRDDIAGDIEPFVRELIERGWLIEVRDADD